MKTTLLILLSVSWPAAFAQRLVAHYPLNNNASDISDNHNNGIIRGGVTPTADRYGNPCGALSFNGTDGFIEVPDSPSLHGITQTFSATCWFKINGGIYGTTSRPRPNNRTRCNE